MRSLEDLLIANLHALDMHKLSMTDRVEFEKLIDDYRERQTSLGIWETWKANNK